MNTVIFLYVIIFGYNSNNTSYRVEMPNLKECYYSISRSSIKVPTGGEAEAGITLFCGTGEVQVNNGGKNWYLKKIIKENE